MSTIRSPFIKVWVETEQGDIELTDKISNFVFEDATKVDNMLELRIIPKYSEVIVEDINIKRGAKLKFLYGYIGGASSSTRTAIIKDIEPDFSSTVVKLTIRALDKGKNLKNTTSSKVWTNITSTDIAKQIAARHRLQINIDPTTRVWDTYPQGNLDDLTFLRKLADEEQAGNYIIFIQDDVLNFVRRGLNTSSKLTITFGQGNNGLIGFKPRLRETTAPTAGAGTSAVGFDFEKKETVVKEAKPEGEEENIVLDDYNLLFSDVGDFISDQTNTESTNPDAVGNDFSESGLPAVIETGKKIMSMSGNPDEVAGKVNATKKGGTFKILEGTLTLQGIPSLKPNEIITLKRFFTAYSGNWLIDKIRHTITGGSSYKTVVSLSKNGSKKPNKNKATAKVTNTTRGKEQIEGTTNEEDEVIILQYNAKGQRTADITKTGAYAPPQDI